VLPHRVVQAAVLCSHGKPLAPRDSVEAHRNFDEHAIQGQQLVQHFSGIARAKSLTVGFATFSFVLAGHSSSFLNCTSPTDTRSNAGREIETFDWRYRGEWGFCKLLKIKSGEVAGMRFPDADDQFFACSGATSGPQSCFSGRRRVEF
jgi:hypothetical protein